MNIFKRIIKRSNADNRFLGEWIVDKTDLSTLNEIGNVKMTFTADGKLTYEFKLLDKRQIINLTYDVIGNKIITDQPSHPHTEESDFEFETSTTLIITFNGHKSRFIKAK
ncbi:hypothetical protein [Mucilaginibacter segetis]|uniref:Lipocalin-like protein n=1 Tax=Mucilaginibacter segetis TaxID=2793071 RepID=A0A934PUS3_9SPHI|nr:hypothetical protein [Mucilaginibacter segetis]MBK0379770.1 hypothetical protein [Mucilaginibacter segetis]